MPAALITCLHLQRGFDRFRPEYEGLGVTPVLPPIAVRPYVFALPERPPLAPNPEVAGWRWVSLDLLLHPETYHSVRLQIRGESRDVPAYELDQSIVWGMTERIMTGLLDQIDNSPQP